MSDPLFDVEGQVVLVSGGSRGIGRALAKGFAIRGAQVIITGRERETVKETAEQISPDGGEVVGMVCDVSDCEAIKSLTIDVVDQFNRIDTLLNVAGINKRQPAVDFSEQEFDAIMDVNLKGAFFLAQAVGKQMIQQGGGCQINIGSVNSQRAFTNLLPYAISKYGIDQMTRSLAVEWGPKNVRVNTLAPGFILTDLTQKLWESEEMENWRRTNTPQQRIGTPEDMVGTALFLASNAAEYLTGQIIYVDGGFTAGRMWPLSG